MSHRRLLAAVVLTAALGTSCSDNEPRDDESGPAPGGADSTSMKSPATRHRPSVSEVWEQARRRLIEANTGTYTASFNVDGQTSAVSGQYQLDTAASRLELSQPRPPDLLSITQVTLGDKTWFQAHLLDVIDYGACWGAGPSAVIQRTLNGEYLASDGLPVGLGVLGKARPHAFSDGDHIGVLADAPLVDVVSAIAPGGVGSLGIPRDTSAAIRIEARIVKGEFLGWSVTYDDLVEAGRAVDVAIPAYLDEQYKGDVLGGVGLTFPGEPVDIDPPPADLIRAIGPGANPTDDPRCQPTRS